MAAFTSLSAWGSLQDRTAANEIVLAYSERRQCVGDAAVDPLDAGDNAQDTAFWKGMQDWVTSKCVKWVNDYDLSTSTEYNSPSDVAYTIATFKTQSTLTGGSSGVIGFRRATTWPTDWTDYEDAAYSYGPIQAGDIRGPWIFEDLQKAFDALRWTYVSQFPGYAKHPSDSPVSISLSSGNVKFATIVNKTATSASDAYDLLEAAWLSASWYTSSGAYQNYGASYSLGERSSDKWDGFMERSHATTVYEDIPDHISHSGSGYYYTNNEMYGWGDDFYDFDSLGLSDTKITLKNTFSAATTNTRTIDSISRVETAPSNQGAGAFEALSVFLLVMKWEFSHTL